MHICDCAKVVVQLRQQGPAIGNSTDRVSRVSWLGGVELQEAVQEHSRGLGAAARRVGRAALLLARPSRSLLCGTNAVR